MIEMISADSTLARPTTTNSNTGASDKNAENSLFAALVAQNDTTDEQSTGDDAPALELSLEPVTLADGEPLPDDTLDTLSEALEAFTAQISETVETTVDTATEGTAELDPTVLEDVASQLTAMLEEFDNSYGTNTLDVLTANAAALPSLPLAFAQDASAAATEVVDIARTLLGVSEEPIQLPTTANLPQQGTPQLFDLQTAVDMASEADVPIDEAQPKLDVGTSKSADSNSSTTQLQSQPVQTETRTAVMFQDLLQPRALTTGDATATQTTQQPASQSAGFASNLTSQIKSAQLTEGTTRIELAPRGLGGIEIDIARTADGDMQVTIRAENSNVLSALRDNREMLLNMLHQNGTNVGNANLEFAGFDQQGTRQQDAEALNTLSTTSAEDEEELTDQTTETQVTTAEGSVDILT